MRIHSLYRRSGLMIPMLGILLGAAPRDAVAQTPQFRGFWADAFHYGYRSAEEVDAMVANAITGGYNAIILEVMAYHDSDGSTSHGAFWNSTIVPKNPAVTDTFDPLAYTCQQAHAQGIDVHAWLFPFRVSQTWPTNVSSQIPSNGQWLMVPYENRGGGPFLFDGSTYWLDGGSPDVQDYLISIVQELVASYPIDGIHWDYELSGVQTNNWYPASNAYANSGLARYMRLYNTVAVPTTTDENWAAYRRRAMDELVRRTQAEIEALEVSTNHPRRPLRHTASLMTYGEAPPTCEDFATSSSYANYADFPTWLQNGWLDAGIPMLYKNPNCNGTQFADWTNLLVNCWRHERHMYIGQANYYNTFENSAAEMAYALEHGADGVVNYSYWSTVGDQCSKTTAHDFAWYPYIAANLFTAPAPLPGMPWRNPATATEGMLFGQVTDSATGLPVDDATIQVGEQASVRTDGNGYYVVSMLPADAVGTLYDITASATRYTGAAYNGVPVVAGGIARQDITLEPSGCWPPAITQHPQSQSVPIGGTATFTVTATGQGTPACQWLKEGLPINNDAHYAGVTTPTLTVSHVDATVAGNYRCSVTNECGTTFSNEGSLTAQEPPTFEFIVESRPLGKNFANYAEVGTWSTSIAKSSAAGTTPGIGSRWAYQDAGTYGLNTATYSFTPTDGGVYEAYVTWPSSTNASSFLEHRVTHANGTASLILSQYGSATANKWISLGQYVLNAGVTYSVTQTNEYIYTTAIMRADAVKWKYIGKNLGVRMYNFSMNSDPGWTTEGQWAFGQPTGGAAEYGFPDPTSGHTGTNVYGYNLDGSYGLSLPATRLTSTPINCTGMRKVSLRFWRWLVVYDPYYDHASVQVSRDGTNWVTLWQNATMILDQAWQYQRFDISAVADNQPTVYLRWTMGPTGNVIDLAGWNIDDVEVWGVTGDIEGDNDVDLDDFTHFRGCFNGPNRAPAGTGCADADFDHDNDVDLDDFTLFRSCFNGPNNLPACP